MSVWSEDKSFKGAALFLRKQANQEMAHMSVSLIMFQK